MIKDFKFFQKIKPVLTNCDLYHLKDIHNRNKYFYLNWSEYPDGGVELKEFNGNILEFDNLVHTTPTIYEIYFERRGYFSHSKVYGNHHQMNPFISRAWKLKIIYSL